MLFCLLALAVYGGWFAGSRMAGKDWQSDETHYAYLADAFNHRRLDIDAVRAPQLTEVIPYGGKNYVVYPPLPAVLLMPVAAVIGTGNWTAPASILFAACAVGLTYVMLRRFGFDIRVSSAGTVLFGFGTCFWYTALPGSSWYLAHVVAVLFLTGAATEAYGAQRPLLTGLLIGAATLSRLPVVLTTPFFLYAVWSRGGARRVRRSAFLLLGIGAFIALNMLYNAARFDSVWSVGYWLIPGVLDSPWYAHGVFDVRYLPVNIFAVLFQPPLILPSFPYFIPTKFGLSLFLATPAFLLMFLAPADRRTLVLATTVLLGMLPGLTHGWPGSSQFGYRFSLDASPFLILLTAHGMRGRVTARNAALIALSVLAAIWGLLYAQMVFPKDWLYSAERGQAPYEFIQE